MESRSLSIIFRTTINLEKNFMKWSARCLPPFVVGEYNDWEEIVEIMKEEIHF